MPWTSILALVIEALKAAPELIKDVEQLVADFKGGSGSPAGSASAAVHQATDQLEAELLAPPKTP